MLKRLAAGLAVAVLFLNSPAQAWSLKEHVLLTRLAAIRLIEDPSTPPGLKTFLQTNMPEATNLAEAKNFFFTGSIGARSVGLTGLQHWCVEPDNRAGDKAPVPPLGLPQRLWHYVDLEYLNKNPDRRVYKHDLSSLPAIADAPRDVKTPVYKEAGVLPFAVQHSYERLVATLKAGKLAGDAGNPKDEDHAVRWAGFLAHYVEDNFQPHHSTQDFQSRSYFADKRKAPNVHSEMEYRMVDDEKNGFAELRADYWPIFEKALTTAKDPATSDDPWTGTMEVARWSYKNLPLIGQAAMAAAGQQGTPDKPVGPAKELDTAAFYRFAGEVDGKPVGMMEMKAQQQAAAVDRVAKLWRKAWDEAHTK
jgi:hypothetical protein